MSSWQKVIQEDGSTPEWPYPIRYDVENEIKTDLLIVGGGIAGSHAAINAARKGVKVAVIDKASVIRSGSGGSGVDHWHQACTNPCSKVTPEQMTEAVVKSWGQYTCGIRHYIQCRESYDALLDVERMGVQVRDVNDEFKGAEFRDEETKLLFAYDYETKYDLRVWGAGMKPALHKELQRLGVEIYNRVMVTSLLTEGGKQGARVVGATGVNIRTGEFYIFRSKATILSTANPHKMWVFSTELLGSDISIGHYDPNATGDGFAIAWKAGVEFAMLEKSQKVLGGFAYPAFGVGNAGNTWFACNIVDSNGKEVPWVDRDGRVLKTVSERYRPAPGQKFWVSAGLGGPGWELAGPTLIPDLPERIQKGEFVLPLYADLPSMPEHERRVIFGLMVGAEGKTRIPIYMGYTQAGFDPDQDMLQVPVADPDAYDGYALTRGMAPRQWRDVGFGVFGGAVIDWDLKTNVEGLYVAGMMMLGASDHSSAAASGRYAGRNAADYILTAPETKVDRKQVEAEKARVYAPVRRKGGIGWKELNAGICRIMQDYCGEYKSDGILKTGLKWFKEIRESETATACARNPHELKHILECQTLITVGEMIMQSSLARKASSSHLNFHRLDYPEVDPPEWGKFVTIRLDNREVRVGELPFNYWLLPPNASTYQENYERHCHL
jgi:succinate dehydrogenase/fumarate reductase flavoprotein subunit